MAPPVVVALAKHPLVDNFDLSSLRCVMSGAAPLDSALQAACGERLDCEVFQGYGLTETSPVTHAWRTDEPCTPGAVGNAPRQHRGTYRGSRNGAPTATVASCGSAGRR